MLDYGSLEDGDEKARLIHWPQALSIVLLVIGAGLITWSFVKPSLSSARAAWSQEQADAYQQTSIKLHGLAHEAIHAAGSPREREAVAELDKARADFEVLKAQLESAISRPNRIAWILRIGGMLVMAAGAGVLYRTSHHEERNA
jgi:hypothetical protein